MVLRHALETGEHQHFRGYASGHRRNKSRIGSVLQQPTRQAVEPAVCQVARPEEVFNLGLVGYKVILLLADIFVKNIILVLTSSVIAPLSKNYTCKTPVAMTYWMLRSVHTQMMWHVYKHEVLPGKRCTCAKYLGGYKQF